MNASGALTGYFGSIPSGLAGVKATLRIMVKVVRSFCKPASTDAVATQALLGIRVTAQNVVQVCQDKDYLCEAKCLHAFVRDKIRYVRDMRQAETIQFPDKTLQLKSGDCDDKAILYATLAECIGFETRFCAIGTDDDGSFSHVSAQVLVPSVGWQNAETIPIDSNGTKAPFGWFPPDTTCLMLAHI